MTTKSEAKSAGSWKDYLKTIEPGEAHREGADAIALTHLVE